jgi:hypothetical protein
VHREDDGGRAPGAPDVGGGRLGGRHPETLGSTRPPGHEPADRRNPVNPLSFDGGRYLVAPRGHTQWVRNLRAAGEGYLLLGRRREHFTAVELDDAEKEPVLRAYLRRWKWEVGQFFGGVGPGSPSEELARIAPDHPVFRIS